METKFTPGPWEVKQVFHVVGDLVNDGNVMPYRPGICRLDIGSNGTYICMSFPEREANARLIATSPELLEALQNLLTHFKLVSPLYSRDRELIRESESVISKALGNN